MTIKGQVVNLVCRLAIRSPFRGGAESLLLSAGRRFPTSRTVQSFARHLGTSMMRREGASFERVVTFASGGKMRCGPEDQIGLLSLQHYFLGTITGQMEDERPIVQFLHRAVRSNDIFFDVGSNLGFYSLYVGPLCGGPLHRGFDRSLRCRQLRVGFRLAFRALSGAYRLWPATGAA